MGEETKQEDTFQHIKSIVESTAFEGKKGSVFAYGQTGSGKTFTVSGGEGKKNGLVHQTIQHVWNSIEEGSSITFVMNQIYMSELKDLLKPEGQLACALELVVDQEGTVSVEGSTNVKFIKGKHSIN